LVVAAADCGAIIVQHVSHPWRHVHKFQVLLAVLAEVVVPDFLIHLVEWSQLKVFLLVQLRMETAAGTQSTDLVFMAREEAVQVLQEQTAQMRQTLQRLGVLDCNLTSPE
jgi:hypothetical protein